jgi:hypothetical protein
MKITVPTPNKKSILGWLTVFSLFSVVPVGAAVPSVSAQAAPSARCVTITTPIKEITGFRKSRQRCVSNTFSGNKFVFLAKKEIDGTDLANEDFKATARLLQYLNRSLVKSWSWSSDGFGRKTVVTATALKGDLNGCVDVFSGCQLTASWFSEKLRRVSFANIRVEWIAGDCLSEPYCSGWYSSAYRMKVTVQAQEEFWE